MHSVPLLSDAKQRGDGTHVNPFPGHCLPKNPIGLGVPALHQLCPLVTTELDAASPDPTVRVNLSHRAWRGDAVLWCCHTAPVTLPSVGRRHCNGDSCQPLRADRRLQIYYRSSASAKAHQTRGRDAPGGDERIPSVEFMWNKLSTGDISS